MKIKKAFQIIQGHQITDEELYIHMGKIPVLTGPNSIKGYWNKQIVKEEDLPCITYPTKGNAGEAYIQSKIFDANNTAILIPYPEYRSKINLEWFSYKLPSIFLQIQTSKGGVSYLNKEIVEEFDININLDIQKKELKYFKKLNCFKKEIEIVKNCVNKIHDQHLIIDNDEEIEILLSEIFDYASRNDSLSEEGIYNKSVNLTDSCEKITVISGAIDEIYGYVPYEEELHTLIDKSCLQVVTRGINAGTINYLSKGRYATNTNAMLLSVKESKKDELKLDNYEREGIYLKYLELYLQPLFYNYRSSGDHSVFPLSKAIDDIKISLLKYSQDLDMIVEKYNILKNYKIFCEKLISRIEDLLSKKLVVN